MRAYHRKEHLLLRADMHSSSLIPRYTVDNPQQQHDEEQVKHSERQHFSAG